MTEKFIVLGDRVINTRYIKCIKFHECVDKDGRKLPVYSLSETYTLAEIVISPDEHIFIRSGPEENPIDERIKDSLFDDPSWNDTHYMSYEPPDISKIKFLN